MKKARFNFQSSLFTTHSPLLLVLMIVMGVVTSCSEGDDSGLFPGRYDKDGSYELSGETGDIAGFIPGGDTPGEGSEENGNTQAGVVTAGEWCDLTHWAFWSGLMQGPDSVSFADKSDYWKFYTNNRVAVRVTDDEGKPLAGLPVKLLRKTADVEATLWEAVTDNRGQAECWVGLYQKENADATTLRVSVNGTLMEGNPLLCPWDSTAQQTAVNHYTVATAKTAAERADIAFVVDATGSMMDEINFLKSDLVDIINKASSVRPSMKMRTAALFYRDEGDEYLTRHSDFTDDLKATAKFVNKQEANGGGDYPEAVHTALEQTLQKLSWDTTAKTRLAFLVLDAPAHHEDKIIQSLQQSVRLCARQGIRLIPVAASGVDKNTEFMLRFFAIATGGTYVFLTNDSGVGGDHIIASVGPYEVEQLNSLIIRLIGQYTE